MAIPVLLAVLVARTATIAQEDLPAVRAGSRVVTVIDGQHVKKDYWFVMPERSPDVYHVEIPRRPHRVTFATDRESISFDTSFGSSHRFVICLEDGRRALTEIRADYQSLTPMSVASASPEGEPSIPFTLGDNDKIYVEGRLNGGEPLRLQVDFGSGGTLVKQDSVPKANLSFDGTITLRNSDGVNVVPASSANELTIHGVSWRDVQVAVADNMTWREDGIVGNALFRDRVVAIDYGRMRLTLHDALPAVPDDWVHEDVILDGGTVPFVRGRLSVGESVREGWFLFDTGAYTSILSSDRLSPLTKLGGELRGLLGPLGGRPAPLVLEVAGRTFTGPNYSVRPFDGDATALGLLGNDVLKRFDVILDNRLGSAYFRANRHMDEGWRNPERVLARLAAVVVVVLAAGGVAWRFRRRSSRKEESGHARPTRTTGR